MTTGAPEKTESNAMGLRAAGPNPGTAAEKPGWNSELRPGWVFKGRIPCLDGLRAVAIAAVILSHLHRRVEALGLPLSFLDTGWLGHLGVTIFFVISGFLITLLLLRENNRAGTINIRDFYIRRGLRIIPAMAVYLLAIFVVQLAGVVTILPQYWVAAGTYLMCFMPDRRDLAPCIGHTWSLSVEEHFYLIWPFALLWIRPKRAWVYVLCYLAATPLLRWLIWSRHSKFLDIDNCSPTQMSSIAIGCLLAFIVSGYALPGLYRALCRRPGITMCLGFGLVAVSLVLARVSGKYAILLSDPVISLGIALAVVGLLHAPEAPLPRLLNTRPAVALGVLSYSLYLWQQPFTPGTTPLADQGPLFVILPLMLGAATASYYVVELPFLRLKETRASRREARLLPERLDQQVFERERPVTAP